MTHPGPVPSHGSGPFLLRRGPVMGTLLFTVLLLAVIAGLLYLQQWGTFPAPPPDSGRPDALTAAHGEDLWFDVDGARVESWLLPGNAAGPAPLLIYTHGNGELIDYWADRFEPIRAAGVHVLLVEYPGYGRSGGRPTERLIIATLLAAYDRMAADARIDAKRIVGHGRSLGGGAIAQLAARRPLAALVLESTFTSVTDMVREHGLPDWLIIKRFDTRAALSKYGAPVLILHGSHDVNVPVANAHALKAVAPNAALHLLDCGHNDCPPQWELVLSFLAANGVCRKPPGGDHENDPC